MESGYIQRVISEKKTAGDIANDLVTHANNVQNQTLKKPLRKSAVAFKNLIPKRNKLLHGKLGTSQSGRQRLFAAEEEWSVASVNDASDCFARVGRDLNAIFHDRLN